MNRFLASFCAFLALSWCAPALAAISAPTLLTASNVVSSGPYTTASVTAPANSFAFVAVSSTSALTALAVTNGGVDIWTCTPVTTASGGGRVGICYTYSAGFTGALTITPVGATTRANWIVGYATNSATSSIIDKTGTVSVNTTNVASVSPDVAVATLAQADELIIGLTLINGTSGTVNDNGADAFIKLTENQAGSGNPNLALSYKVTNAINGVGSGYAYGTSWTTGHAYTAMAWSFKGLPGGAKTCLLGLLGVGSC